MLSNSGCYTSLGFKTAKVVKHIYSNIYIWFYLERIPNRVIAQVKYAISKNGMPVMRGDPDICDTKNSANAENVKMLALLGFPTECPLPAVTRNDNYSTETITHMIYLYIGT